jgi:exodeoxyribonuclease VII small subunit
MTKRPKEETEPVVRFDLELEKLRAIVERMEKGDLTLDESLKLFEEGIVLAGRLFEVLNQAEGKVEELLESMQRVPFSRAEE